MKDSSKIDAAIKATEELLKKAQDPPMQEVLKQLQAMKAGQKGQYSVARIIAYQYTPAPNKEIQDWAEKVLDAWESFYFR